MALIETMFSNFSYILDWNVDMIAIYMSDMYIFKIKIIKTGNSQVNQIIRTFFTAMHIKNFDDAMMCIMFSAM